MTQALDINLIELLNLSAKLLDQLFIKASEENAKQLFKDIKAGKPRSLGNISIHKKLQAPVKITLDHSEFVGPGFNFSVFRAGLVGVLSQISEKFKTKAEPNILRGDNNSFLFHLPGIVKINDQFNVLVLALELGDLKTITIKLMYLDPGQYQALQKTPATVSA